MQEQSCDIRIKMLIEKVGCQTDDKTEIEKQEGAELPPDFYSVLQAIVNKKAVIITESKRDADNLNYIFENEDNYIATGIWKVKYLSYLYDAIIYLCCDIKQATDYMNNMQVFETFKVIKLPSIEDLENKGVLDWLNAGHTKSELIEVFGRSLDLNNKYELQQDTDGIYKTILKVKDETKVFITNFSIIKAESIEFVDKSVSGIMLTCKAPYGSILEKVGEVTVFDDLKSFRNFLGSMELTFKGDLKDLLALKQWINKYFIFENKYIYDNPRFRYESNTLCFITNNGAIFSDKLDFSRKSQGDFKVEIMAIKSINKSELEEVVLHLFNFSTLAKSYSIIGTLVNNLAVGQAEKLKISFHHLLIVGESGSGKTTILKNVIAPLLNYPKANIQSIGLITYFALIKELSSGNFSIIFDEFKPSSMDKYKKDKTSEILRNLYDRSTTSRGNKSLLTKKFLLERPIIIAGEESFPNQETALMERSCIVYLSKDERSMNNENAMDFLRKNEKLLNKLGRSLIDIILKLSVKEYADIREKAIKKLHKLSDRPLNTAVNICTGIEIFNKLLKSLNLPEITNYAAEIESNMLTEVLELREKTYSTVERMLILYNEMIESDRAVNPENVIQYREDGLFIRTSEMLTQLRVHNKNTDLNMQILSDADFKKQAQKSGYIIKLSGKQVKVKAINRKFDIYDIQKVRSLKLDAIIPPEFTELGEISEKEMQVIFPEKFKKLKNQ